MANYCEEHGLVRESLGRLEAGQETILIQVRDINKRLERIAANGTSGQIEAAVSNTKAGILYWVIMIVVVAGVSGFFSYFFAK